MSIDPQTFSAQRVEALAQSLAEAPLLEVLRWAASEFGSRAAVGTSFQGAGLVMLHHAFEAGLKLPVFTIDTGLLFPETVALKGRLEAFWGIHIESLEPEQTLEQQALEQGDAALWARRPDTCCTLRKVIPLQQRLETLSVWITGVRREQSATREGADILERYLFDPLGERYLLKLNPMVAWSRKAIWDYIHAHGIPYNPLHDAGYRSIGCMPCTKASGEGDSERAGRWTGFAKTECGIHTFLGART
jgi:phosphoadenosine phosphosulfate reductase